MERGLIVLLLLFEELIAGVHGCLNMIVEKGEIWRWWWMEMERDGVPVVSIPCTRSLVISLGLSSTPTNVLTPHSLCSSSGFISSIFINFYFVFQLLNENYINLQLLLLKASLQVIKTIIVNLCYGDWPR